MRAACLTLLGLLATVGPVAAQGLALTGEGSGPLEIDATDGIEWRRAERKYIANGNARAARDGVELTADRLVAYYRESETGDSEIWRIDAGGNVKITSATEQVQGDNGKYDLDQGVVVMTGGNLKLTTPTDTITARDALEYWERKQVAVARGDAIVRSGERTVRGEVLQAHFRESVQGDLVARLVEGFRNVCLQSTTSVARGERGDYDLESGMAHLRGNVRISQNDNMLVGPRAEVNMNTGVSRIIGRTTARIPSAAGGGDAATPIKIALRPCA